jgi:hypothetical protein
VAAFGDTGTAVWDHGVDTSFLPTAVVLIVFAMVTAWAYVQIRRSRGQTVVAQAPGDGDTIAI